MVDSLRTEILQHATRLFAEQGYEGTSLQAIADAVGIRKPSLLYHFPSKADLHRAVLDGVLARWSDVLPRLLMAAAREERFDAVMEEMISFFRADPDRARLLIREALDRPDDMRERLTNHVRPWLEVLVAQLDRARDQGLVHRDVDVVAYVIQVVNLVVCGIATADTMRALLPDQRSAEGATDRQISEMLRVARASLFVTPR